MTYAINYNGLKKRETYEEIIDYLEDKQEKIKYPNRVATQLRQSHQLSNLLDGEGMNIIDVEKQNERAMEQKLADMQMTKMASETGIPKAHLTAATPPQTETLKEEIFHDVDDAMNQAGQDVDMEIQRQEEIRAELQRGAEKMVRESLQYTTPITPAHQIAIANTSSSSSSRAPMLVNREGEQQKRPEETPEVTSKPKAKQRTSQSVPARKPPQPTTPMMIGNEGEQQKRGTANGNGTAKKKTKDEPLPQTAVVKALEQPQNTSASSSSSKPAVQAIEATPTTTSSSSSSKPREEPETEKPKPEKPNPPVKKTIKKDKPREDPHGTKKDMNQNPKYWDRKNVGYLIDQLSLHGVKLNPSQLKGKDKLKKAELAKMIKEKLGI